MCLFDKINDVWAVDGDVIAGINTYVCLCAAVP